MLVLRFLSVSVSLVSLGKSRWITVDDGNASLPLKEMIKLNVIQGISGACMIKDTKPHKVIIIIM